MKIYFNSAFLERERITDDSWVKGNNGNKLEAFFDELDISNPNFSFRLVIGWGNGERTNELPMIKSFDNKSVYINLPTLKYSGNAQLIIIIYENTTIYHTTIFSRKIKESIDASDETNITPTEYEAMLRFLVEINDKLYNTQEKVVEYRKVFHSLKDIGYSEEGKTSISLRYFTNECSNFPLGAQCIIAGSEMYEYPILAETLLKGLPHFDDWSAVAIQIINNNNGDDGTCVWVIRYEDYKGNYYKVENMFGVWNTLTNDVVYVKTIEDTPLPYKDNRRYSLQEFNNLVGVELVKAMLNQQNSMIAWFTDSGSANGHEMLIKIQSSVIDGYNNKHFKYLYLSSYYNTVSTVLIETDGNYIEYQNSLEFNLEDVAKDVETLKNNLKDNKYGFLTEKDKEFLVLNINILSKRINENKLDLENKIGVVQNNTNKEISDLKNKVAYKDTLGTINGIPIGQGNNIVVTENGIIDLADYSKKKETEELIDEKINEQVNEDLTATIQCDCRYEITGDTGNEHGLAITDQQALIPKIKGRTLVKNQLVLNNYEWTLKQTSGDITATFNNYGNVTLNGTVGESDFIYSLTKTVKFSGERKFFITGCPAGGSWATYFIYDQWSSNIDLGNSCLFSSSMGELSLWLVVKAGTTVNNLTFTPRLIDLTLAYGAGNEPTTVEEVLKDFPEYIPYTEGTFVHSNNTLVSTGRNLWDEEYFKGHWSEIGTKVQGTNYISTLNYIPVIPNTTYSSNSMYYWCMFDKDKNFIERRNGSSITTTSNCYYVQCTTNDNYGSNYNNDIIICYGSTALPYEPYKEDVISGIGELKAFDYIDNVTGDKVFETKLVDLGSLDYTRESDGRFYSTAISDAKIPTSGEYYKTILCERYIPSNDPISSNETDYTIAMYADKRLYLYNSNYTDASSLKASLSGVMLAYELETPTYEETTLPAGYAVAKGGLQIQRGTIPYDLTKEYSLNIKAQVLNNIEIDKQQQALINNVKEDLTKTEKSLTKRIDNNQKRVGELESRNFEFSVDSNEINDDFVDMLLSYIEGGEGSDDYGTFTTVWKRKEGRREIITRTQYNYEIEFSGVPLEGAPPYQEVKHKIKVYNDEIVLNINVVRYFDEDHTYTYTYTLTSVKDITKKNLGLEQEENIVKTVDIPTEYLEIINFEALFKYFRENNTNSFSFKLDETNDVIGEGFRYWIYDMYPRKNTLYTFFQDSTGGDSALVYVTDESYSGEFKDVTLIVIPTYGNRFPVNLNITADFSIQDGDVEIFLIEGLPYNNAVEAINVYHANLSFPDEAQTEMEFDSGSDVDVFLENEQLLEYIIDYENNKIIHFSEDSQNGGGYNTLIFIDATITEETKQIMYQYISTSENIITTVIFEQRDDASWKITKSGSTKQYEFITRENLKTINGQSLYGSGDIKIEGGSGSGSSIGIEDNLTSTSTTNALSANQGKILNDKINQNKTNADNTYAPKTTVEALNTRLTNFENSDALRQEGLINVTTDVKNANGVIDANLEGIEYRIYSSKTNQLSYNIIVKAKIINKSGGETTENITLNLGDNISYVDFKYLGFELPIGYSNNMIYINYLLNGVEYQTTHMNTTLNYTFKVNAIESNAISISGGYGNVYEVQKLFSQKDFEALEQRVGNSEEKINSVEQSLRTTDEDITLLNERITSLENSGGGSSVNVEDNLTSISTTNALSANQGRFLKGEIVNLQDSINATDTDVANLREYVDNTFVSEKYVDEAIGGALANVSGNSIPSALLWSGNTLNEGLSAIALPTNYEKYKMFLFELDMISNDDQLTPYGTITISVPFINAETSTSGYYSFYDFYTTRLFSAKVNLLGNGYYNLTLENMYVYVRKIYGIG